MASSKEVVCRDWVWPNAAAIASMVVRATLVKGSCSVKDHPEVWLCALSAKDLGSLGLNWLTISAQSNLPALNLAISIKWFIPMAQKKDKRGAKSSMSIPA